MLTEKEKTTGDRYGRPRVQRTAEKNYRKVTHRFGIFPRGGGLAGGGERDHSANPEGGKKGEWNLWKIQKPDLGFSGASVHLKNSAGEKRGFGRDKKTAEIVEVVLLNKTSTLLSGEGGDMQGRRAVWRLLKEGTEKRDKKMPGLKLALMFSGGLLEGRE